MRKMKILSVWKCIYSRKLVLFFRYFRNRYAAEKSLISQVKSPLIILKTSISLTSFQTEDRLATMKHPITSVDCNMWTSVVQVTQQK